MTSEASNRLHAISRISSMNNFSAFLHANGLLPRDVVADGRWHRCPTTSHPKKKNGSFKFAADGLIGWCLDYAVHSEPLTWRQDKSDAPAKIDHAAIDRRQAQARRDLVRATQAARSFYLGCKPLRGGHPYLASHGLAMTGCFGLKIDAEGWIVVPVLLDGNLMSVQRISPDGDKRFWSGASVKAGSYAVERRHASVTVLCEGLATGLAIFEATPLARVLVAFDAGNMRRVPVPRQGMVVVAADNDFRTALNIGRNPGLEAATEAAEAIGCGVALPTGLRAGSDWCDFRMERVAHLLNDNLKARDGDIRRRVDAEIAAAIMRNATFLR